MSDVDALDKLVQELKCDLCGKHLSCSPVLLSSGGENVCGRCQAPGHPQHTFTRNHVYEKVATAAQLLFPCKNRDVGCPERLLMSQVQLHEVQCSFNEIERSQCPAATGLDIACSWTGEVHDLEAHYRAAHDRQIVDHPYTVKQDFYKETSSSLLMMVYGFAFLVQMKCAEGKVWQSVRLLEQTCLAKLFKYSVKFKKGGSFIEETKQVANSNILAMDVQNSASNIIKNLLILLGDYDDMGFELSITMRDIHCYECERKLDCAPIHPALEEDSYSCATCHQEKSMVEEPVEPAVNQSVNQNLTRQNRSNGEAITESTAINLDNDDDGDDDDEYGDVNYDGQNHDVDDDNDFGDDGENHNFNDDHDQVHVEDVVDDGENHEGNDDVEDWSNVHVDAYEYGDVDDDGENHEDNNYHEDWSNVHVEAYEYGDVDDDRENHDVIHENDVYGDVVDNGGGAHDSIDDVYHDDDDVHAVDDTENHDFYDYDDYDNHVEFDDSYDDDGDYYNDWS